MKTIFKRPLFVNPQAYTTIPELYSIDKLQSFNFDENDTYTTKLVYNGRVESIIKKAGEEHILHLDLYTVDGSCVLGEWYVKGIDSESVVTIDKNILTIVANNNLKYPGLIAAWSAKGKTNEDVDRNVLKDLTGNGHDITLNNFAYSGMSGYGGYKDDCRVWLSNYTINFQTKTKFSIKGKINRKNMAIAYAMQISNNKSKMIYKVTGASKEFPIAFGYGDNGINDEILVKAEKDGIYEVNYNANSTKKCVIINTETAENVNILIELLPEYPDALVFDGVDDYGINEDMPILKDYTIIAKRKLLGENIQWLISKRIGDYWGAFNFEYRNNNIESVRSFGNDNILNLTKGDISWQTKNFYNQKNIVSGEYEDTNEILIGAGLKNQAGIHEHSNITFYSAYLFDRSLDDQEIKSFIRKHIDPEYILPSEIPAITLISNDTLIDNSTLIKNN